MSTEITMPKLSDTMIEGRLGVWRKGIGDAVQRGDVIAEVETDKAVMDLEAFSSGVLLETRVKPGELVAVGTVIGVIGAAGETVGGVATPATSHVSTEVPQEVQGGTGSGQIRPTDETASSVVVLHDEERHDGLAAPIVRRRARELGIDLVKVAGSGPGGRIMLADLERYGEQSAFDTGQAPAVPHPTPAGGEPLSRMRAAIARTVSESWRTIPHFSVTVEIRMNETEEVRRELTESGTQVSLNDMVVKGVAMALEKFPLVNASFTGESLIIHDEINIGIAVSLPDGLLVPVIKGCSKLSLREIALQCRLLVEKARSGRISETEISGGTFSVSNLGMYGVKQFTAVIHPPQAAILAIGEIHDALSLKNNLPVTARTMQVTLSADHRIVDGAYAAEFLRELRHILENPVQILL